MSVTAAELREVGRSHQDALQADLATEQWGLGVARFGSGKIGFQDAGHRHRFIARSASRPNERGVGVQDAGKFAASVKTPVKRVERGLTTGVKNLGAQPAQVAFRFQEELYFEIGIVAARLDEEHGDGPHRRIQPMRRPSRLFGSAPGMNEPEDTAGFGVLGQDQAATVESQLADNQSVEFVRGEGADGTPAGQRPIP